MFTNTFWISLDLVLAFIIWFVTGNFGYTSIFFARLVLLFIIAYAVVPLYLEFTAYPLLYLPDIVELRLLSSFVLLVAVLSCCLLYKASLCKTLPSVSSQHSSAITYLPNTVVSPILSKSLLLILLLFPIGLLVSYHFSWTSLSNGIGRNVAAYIKLAFVSCIAIYLTRNKGKGLGLVLILSSVYMFFDGGRTFFFQILILAIIMIQPRLSIKSFMIIIAALILMLFSGSLRHSNASEVTLLLLFRPLVGELLWGSFSFSSAIIALSNDQYWKSTQDYGVSLFTPFLDISNHYLSVFAAPGLTSLSQFKDHLYSNGVLPYPFAPLEGSFFPADFILILGVVGGSFVSVFAFFSLYVFLLKVKSLYSLKAAQLSTLPIFLKATILDFSKYFIAVTIVTSLCLALLSIYNPSQRDHISGQA